MESREILKSHLAKIMKIRRVLSIFVILFGGGMTSLALEAKGLSSELQWAALALAVVITLAGVLLFASTFKPVERHPLLVDLEKNPKNILKIARHPGGRGTWCLNFHRAKGRQVKIYGTDAQTTAWLARVKKDLPHIP
jgi:hypothetical protein